MSLHSKHNLGLLLSLLPLLRQERQALVPRI